MKQFGRAVCPYCGKKVNLIITWSLRRRGEYRCPHCLGISNVTLSTAVLSMAFAAIALSALILAATLLLMEEAVWWSVLAVAAPFLLFYILSLFCVQLRVPVLRRAPAPQDKKNSIPAHSAQPKQAVDSQENLDETRAL